MLNHYSEKAETTLRSFVAFAMAFTLMACAASITSAPDELGVDAMIQRDIGIWSIEVGEHSDRNCRRVFQTIEEIWYIACKDRGQLIVKMEEQP
jgi:hypothetical protein